jgi:hypothetical protein
VVPTVEKNKYTTLGRKTQMGGTVNKISMFFNNNNMKWCSLNLLNEMNNDVTVAISNWSSNAVK